MPDLQDLEDSELIETAKNGDAQAFGVLYERYSPQVYRFFAVHLNVYLDAEDLTVEVFLRAGQNLNDYEEKGIPFLAYLFTVSRNMLIDFYRHSDKFAQVKSIEDQELHDTQPKPEDALMMRLQQEEIRNTLGRLPEDYQMVLILRFLSELSPDETARVMKRSPGAIRVLQHRALAALRDLLEKTDGEKDED
jgi:RNA polymerase sigma-70 factor (ECF subfamily)